MGPLLTADLEKWLVERTRLSKIISSSKYDFRAYIERAVIYKNLDFPDLAVGDANKALLLIDELLDDCGEYHDDVEVAVDCRLETQNGSVDPLNASSSAGREVLLEPYTLACYVVIAECLRLCGCLRSAADFCIRGLKRFANDEELLRTRNLIFNAYKKQHDADPTSTIDIDQLPEQGFVRREVYPWNDKEPDRFSAPSLQHLNQELSLVAPRCEVRVVRLPNVAASNLHDVQETTNLQLGIFAKEDIAACETILREKSLLTTSNRTKDPFCDACSAPLPSLCDAQSSIVSCPDCDDIVFCSEKCLEAAIPSYHSAICGADVDVLSAEPTNVKYSSDSLYLLLLQRLLAMSVSQKLSPLSLKEIKYIWGDFVFSNTSPQPRTLPFTFFHNISGPLAILTKMNINIFDPPVPDLSETWVHNTIYAKFRGTASAFLSEVSQKPETAAVHPLWCLSNHDCDPNVAWNWRGGEIRFWVREESELAPGSTRKPGLRKGEEIRSHYCDVRMNVKERRAWAEGSLGGDCVCDRCVREAAVEQAAAAQPLSQD